MRNIRFFVALASIILALPSHGSGQEPFGEQRLTLAAQGRPTIVAMIGKKGPFSFVVDTGSSQTIFGEALIAALGEDAKPGKPITITTASGAVGSQTFRVKDISTAGVTLEDLDVLRLAIPNFFNADGVLGSDFLSHFNVELDWAGQKFRLYRVGTLPALRGLKRVPGKLDGRRLLTMRARCRNAQCKVILDTGGLVSLGNPALGLVLVPSRQTQTTLDYLEVTGLWSGKIRAQARLLPKLEMGGARWTNRYVSIADLPVFHQLDQPNQPTLFLGLDLLGKGRLVIDYDRATMYLGQ